MINLVRNRHPSHMQIVLCLQVQEEGLVLPDALVWQVLWEVAQVKPLACCRRTALADLTVACHCTEGLRGTLSCQNQAMYH